MSSFRNCSFTWTSPLAKRTAGLPSTAFAHFSKRFASTNEYREVVDKWQDHSGDRRPTAGDLYYKLSDGDSQKFMNLVPFGTGKSAADAGETMED